MGLDTWSHRQHRKLSLLPQDAHPALGSHHLQRRLLLEVKTLCFSWILVHQGLLPVHRPKQTIRNTLNHMSYGVLVSLSHFISLEEQVVSIHCNKRVAYSMPVGIKHSMSSPAYHPSTRLSSLAVARRQKYMTHSRNFVLEVVIASLESSKHRKQQSLSQEQLLDTSDSKDIVLTVSQNINQL